MKQALRFLGGSIATYFVVAACTAASARHPDRDIEASGGGDATASSTDSSAAGMDGGSSGGESSSGGASSNGASGSGTGGEPNDAGLVDAVVDAMTDPIPDAKADPAESGDRLKARYMVGEDGSRSFVGWYDSELEVNCFFYLTPDGQQRCVPSGDLAYASAYFSDSDCSTRVFQSALGCSYRYGLATTAGESCATTTYSVYELTAVSPTTVYRQSGEVCQAVEAPQTSQLYTGVELAPSTFVAGQEEVDS